MSPSVVFLVAVALFVAVSSGYNGSGSLAATVISTRATGARRALFLAAAASFVGLFLFGTAVAVVVATGLVDPTRITLAGLGAGLLAALLWNSLASALGIPSSSSHALIGGLIGGGIASDGLGVVQVGGLLILLVALVVAPIATVLIGAATMRATLWLVAAASPRINEQFRVGQILTLTLLALSYGTSNGQRIVGIIALILYRGGASPQMLVPDWIVVATALGQSLGIAVGGTRVIRKVGASIFRLRPVDGFVAQGVAAAIILLASLLGSPVSMNQITSSALIGAGMADRRSKLRWDVVQELLLAWTATLPVTALAAIAIYPIAHLLIR